MGIAIIKLLTGLGALLIGFKLLSDNIEKLADNNGNIENDKIAGSVGSSVDILDVISSWNSTYHNQSLMRYIAKFYNDIEDKQTKDTAKKSCSFPAGHSGLPSARIRRQQVRQIRSRLPPHFSGHIKNVLHRTVFREFQ